MENLIESIEFYDYKPPLSEKFDNAGSEFPITAYNEDIVTQPCKSLLVLRGKVEIEKGTDAVPIPNNLTTFNFVTNGLLHLFDHIDYYIGDNKIDSIRKPGVATTMKGLVCFETDLKYNNAGWNINSPNTVMVNSDGYFSQCIPLSIVMGFFEDYKRFLFRMPQKLVFYRNTGSNSNCYITTSGTDHSITLTLSDIVWRMPQIKFNLDYETKIRNDILKNTNYDLEYRRWWHQSISGLKGSEYSWDIPVAYARTKYVLLAFQYDRINKPGIDNSKFDFMDLENVQVQLNNGTVYPRERLNLKFNEYRCSNLYNMFKKFKSSYYDCDEDSVDPLFTYQKFLTDYPIIAIDCSFQPDVIKNTLINIRINFAWREDINGNTMIHCLLITDDKAVYNPLNTRVIH